MNKKLCLCIPAYNAEKYIPRLLRSALNQTKPFDEILVYDDCSTDNTGNIARSFGAKVFRGHINKGCSYGKNYLASKTDCEWLHFHDADDELLTNFVESTKKWIEKEFPPDVVLFSYEYRDNETNELYVVRHYDGDRLRNDPIEYTLCEKVVSICGIYRKKSFLDIGGYDLDPNVLYNEDEAFHYRLARSGIKFDADNTVTLINYFLQDSMSSSNQLKCAQAQFYLLKKSSELLDSKYNNIISYKMWMNATILISYLDFNTAKEVISYANKLGGVKNIKSSNIFKILCKINPYYAFLFREYFIRIFKPRLRKNNLNYKLI